MKRTLLASVIASLALASCGGGDDGSGGGPLTGEPGNPDNVSQTIEVSALDELEFDPSDIEVGAGDTIEFVVTNEGQADHEFVLGESSEDDHGDMGHADLSATGLIPPGETKSVIWTFTEAGEVGFACHVDGHAGQGMTGTITVTE